MTCLNCLVSYSIIKWLEIMAWWCICIVMNCDLLFPAFVGSLFKYFLLSILYRLQDGLLHFQREILQGQHRPLYQVPLASANLVKICIACLYSNQNKLPVLETCSVLMSSVLQSSSELVPKSSKAQNAAAAKLLMSWGSMASPVLKMQAASQGIQPSTPSSRGHWPALVY